MTETAAPLKKIAEGREAEMFDWGDGRVLRLYRPEVTYTSAAHQARLLDIAATSGVPVPAQYGPTSVDGRDGIILERLDGPDLLTELGSKPWKVLSIAGICGRLQARINACVAPPEIESLHDRFRRIISHNNLIPGEIKTAALSHLDRLPEGDRLLHGDFHPGNVMWKNGEPAVIDWSNVTRGPAEADYFRTYLMGTLGSLPPGTPLLLRVLTPFARRIFRDSNARAYKRVAKPDPEVVKAWRLPVATARIAEGIEDEREALLRFMEQLLR